MAVMAVFHTNQAMAGNAISGNRIGSIVITFDAPVIDRCNQAGEFYNLLVRTIRSESAGIMSQIKSSGALWSASHNLNGIQFALYHFDDPARAAQICKRLLSTLNGELRKNFPQKVSREFADYIHSLPSQNTFISEFRHKPVSVSLSENMAAYEYELAETAEIASFFVQTQTAGSRADVLPDVAPTAYTIFNWPENSAESFFTAKYLGEKFSREAGLDDLLKYAIIYGDASLSLIVYISGSEEILADKMPKFRQINQFQLEREPPADWSQFSLSLSEIVGDDLRDVAKKALFDAWQKHWRGEFKSLRVDLPVAPKQQFTGICLPEAHQHLLSFSNAVFPGFAATCHGNGGNSCDVAIAIGGDNHKIVDEIQNNLEKSPPAASLSLIRDPEMLKILFHCKTNEVGGVLARIRNHIYNNLVEKGLISEPIDVLKIGIAGVSGLPPFEMRGLLQKGWVPVAYKRQTTPLSDYLKLLRVENASAESHRQRWQLYLASNRGRSELLAMIAATGHSIKDFVLPQ